MRDLYSTNSNVATVSPDGIITANAPGRADIIAVATDGSREDGDCEVTVGNTTGNNPPLVYIDDIEFEPDDIFLNVGQVSKLNVEIEPYYATNKNLSFTSSNPAIATVDNSGNVTGLTPGITIITARAMDGSNESDNCTVIVRSGAGPSNILIKDIDVEPDNLTMNVGQSQSLYISIQPQNATNQNLTYYSNNNAVATVSNGVVTAVGPGTATITVSAMDGSNEYDTCRVSVTGTPSGTDVPVTDIDFQEDELYLPLGQSLPIVINIEPSNATNPTYSIENLSDKIISFTNNTVTAVSPGTGFLVVRALDGTGIVDICKVNVIGSPTLNPGITVPVTEVDIDSNDIPLQVGSSSNLKVQVKPYNASNKILNYKANDPMIATVNENGIVTGVSAGTTIITATATDGTNLADACVVKVVGNSQPSPDTPVPSVIVSYDTHVENIGWQTPVQNGAIAGTTGQRLRLEGIHINVSGNSNLGIEYRTHVENIGWQNAVSNGALAGTTGQALRLEAIQIKLTGTDASLYDVYYRVHAQDVGWMNWAKNGESAGTTHFARRVQKNIIKDNRSYYFANFFTCNILFL